MPAIGFPHSQQTTFWCFTAVAAVAAGITVKASAAVVTNVMQLGSLASAQPLTSHALRLEGTVWWASRVGDRLVLHDASGAAEIESDWKGQQPRLGQRVRVGGDGTIARIGARFRLGVKGPVVDNDGEHSLIEKSGAVYLPEALNPIQLEWFNGVDAFGLELDYEGPGVPRQRIPSSMLFQPPTDAGKAQPGVLYRCYTGTWQALPVFDELIPVQSGILANFDLSVRPRLENVALVFQGQLLVPRSGLYVFHLRSDDGSRLFVGKPTLSLEVIGDGQMPEPRAFALGQSWVDPSPGAWGVVEGRITRIKRAGGRTLLQLSGGATQVNVELGDDAGAPSVALLNHRVRVTGFCQPVVTAEGDRVVGVVLVPDFGHIERSGVPAWDDSPVTHGGGHSELPVLTNAVDVQRLKREQAERGYPVLLRGVVTSVLPEHQAFTLQDATRGLYVEDFSEFRSRPPHVGEFLRVEGVTDPSLFAPIVSARLVESLGLGQMPNPIKPTWDQLMTGSLDAQFVELEGFITAVQSNSVSLMTRAGVISVELRIAGMAPEDLAAYENALVRVHGCLFASWDYLTHQVKLGEIRIYDANLVVEQPAPMDLFSSPTKTAAELLLFDPQAGALQRIKVSGQIVHVRGLEHFMMNEGRGVRFLLSKPDPLREGDEVEVVGFPELLGGGAPVLRQAVARRTGHRALPEARPITSEQLVDSAYDSTLVRVEGLLAGVRNAGTEQVLEIQSGVRSFVARVPAAAGFLEVPPVGSRLELRGVYAGHGGVWSMGVELAGFELLLSSPSDIRVLARPPWWTLRRLLVIVGVLACVLAATMLWVTQLRRQVEQRGAELALRIQEKEQVEHQRAIEQERARIAQDLHDELGSGITEISMLAARAKSAAASDERRGQFLEEALARAREMVTALDEIVWAMDPHHDSLSSLVSYFSLYADRFLGLAGIGWRLEGDAVTPDRLMGSRPRYQLFLVFKEALNNVVRHAGAGEVRVRFAVERDGLCLEICDNGRGLPQDGAFETMSGISNMKARIERMGGRFDLVSSAARGTTVQLQLPWTRIT
jgi:signal transduction histidine kinase